MKFRRSYRSIVLVLAGTWILFPTVAVSSTQIQPDCLAANSFLEKELYEDAERIYNNLLKIDPKLTCAKEGINKLRTIPYQKAITLYEEGIKFQTLAKPDLEKAKQKYSEALSIYSDFQKAKQALKEVEDLLNKQKEGKFNAAHQLDELGLHAEAREKIKKIIEEDTDAKVTDKEKNLFGGELILGWQRLLNWLGLWAPIIVFGLLFVMLLLRWIILPILSLPFLKLPFLKGFKNWLWELISQPSLNIESFDKGGTELDIGKTLAAMVEEECHNVRSKEDVQSVARKMTIVTAPTGELKLPDVKSLVPQLGIIYQLANILPSLLSLLGRKSFTLSGHLLPPSDRGVGLTLTLKNERGTIIYKCTIWQKDYDPELSSKPDNSKNPAPYYFLVEPAAIWTLFQLDDKITKLNIKDWSGVKNWKSYAYFRAGVYWGLKEKKRTARILFCNSLNEDYNNRLSLLNLAILDILESEDSITRNIGIERLSLLSESDKKDNVWYKSTYNLAAIYLHQSYGYTENHEKDESLKRVQRKAFKLVDEIRKGKELGNNDVTTDFLESIEPLARTMYAVVLVLRNDTPEANRQISEVNKNKVHSYRVEYNLACYYSHIGECNDALDALSKALDLKPTLAKSAQKDPSLQGVRDNRETKSKFNELVDRYYPRSK